MADYKKLLLQDILHWRRKQYIFEEHLGEYI